MDWARALGLGAGLRLLAELGHEAPAHAAAPALRGPSVLLFLLHPQSRRSYEPRPPAALVLFVLFFFPFFLNMGRRVNTAGEFMQKFVFYLSFGAKCFSFQAGCVKILKKKKSF